MKASVDGKQVPLEHINLDDLEWDHRRYHGSATLDLQLTADDLLAIGKAIYAEAQAAIAEDSEYFEGDFAHLPVPASETVFLDNPEMLGVYLTEYAFWNRYTIEKVVHHIKHLSRARRENRYLILEYRGVVVEDGQAILTLGVEPQSRW